ncbi:conserved hypothetical protein [Gloeothece citriformis PCC 7424]|uniref:Uncharacterized protein n=1 Tax=Gloeothece citriformis (strain PCC 7424) TaxID=65393 RepID=B7KLA6_GLOC7|nr:hypothetical protein [Gloeothece citriformis]ACK72478.1 conserved hypothetical protein [Gloeothece citriformis PCC 7424]
MKNLMTVVALMISVTGVGVSLAREEVRCYLGLSSSACHSTPESLSSPQKANSTPSSQTESSSQPQETEEKPPIKLPSAIEEITKIGKEALAPSSESSPEVTNPTTEEEPPTEPPQISRQQPEEKTDISSPTYLSPITEPVELEVIPPPEDSTNSSQN